MNEKPGRSRSEHKNRGKKEWTRQNTQVIEWARLQSFLRKHAKVTDDFVSETFARVTLI